MMTARVTNIRQDYDYTINDIALVNYVDNTIILVNKLGETFTYNSQEVVIAIAMQERKKIMKKEYQGQCTFCGQPISTKQVGVGYTKTKRKTITLFHEECYEMYCKGCEEKASEVK